MALVLADRVQETTNTTGTGTLTLAGAVTGYQSFSTIGNANTTYYTITDGTLWEVGIGTYTLSGTTLSRDTVLASSAGGTTKISVTAGSRVFCDYPAGRSVYMDSATSTYALGLGATTASTGAFTYISTSSSTSTTPTLTFNGSNSPYAAGATIAGSYLQHLLQNKSGTAGASTNYVLSNDIGTDSTYYGEFGMNSSVYSSGTPADFFSLNNGIYFSGHDGDITVGSGNGFKTYLAWGTTGDKAHVINASGALGLNTNITGTTNFGTSGQVLISGGNAATPTWTTNIAGNAANVTGIVLGANGGTGVANTGFTFTMAGNVSHAGAFTQTFTATGNTSVTLPTAGTLATLAGTETFTNKRVTPRAVTTTSSATPTINTDTTDIYGLTAQAVNITSFTTNLSGTPTDGQKLWIYIVGTAARTISWGASFEASTVALPTTTVTTNRLDVGFVWNTATTKWRCVAVA